MKNKEDKKYVGYKIILRPNDALIDTFIKYFDVRVYVYNWGIDQIEKYPELIKFENGKPSSIKTYNLNNMLTEYKKDNIWLNDYDSTSLKLVLFDLTHAYEQYFEGTNNKPIYHHCDYANRSFSIRTERLSIYDDEIYQV